MEHFKSPIKSLSVVLMFYMFLNVINTFYNFTIIAGYETNKLIDIGLAIVTSMLLFITVDTFLKEFVKALDNLFNLVYNTIYKG